MTVNEDGNSSIYTIDPSETGPQAVHQYSYSPSVLPHGGGTDAISVMKGRIFLSASAPTTSTGPAMYSATLSGSTAYLSPVFDDNSTAVGANFNSPDFRMSQSLALTDPDSNEVVPHLWPRFGGDLVLDS